MPSSAPVPTASPSQAPPAEPGKVELDPITAKARMSAAEYRQSFYFNQDNRGLGFKVFIGFAFVVLCGTFSIPWSLMGRPLVFNSFVDVIHFVAEWGALPIFLLMFAATTHARRALSDFGVNIAIAQHVERSAEARLRALRNDPKRRGSVSTLQSEHLPDNPSDPKPAAYRLFQRICAEAQDRRFESTINLIEPYQRESMEPVLKLEGVQRTALRWGILCHFIGLVLVINAVPAMLDAARSSDRPVQAIASLGAASEAAANSSTAAGPISGILDGLRLAFGASVGGLAVSIFAGWMLAQVRRKQFSYFRKLDEATATMISLATNSLNNDELLASLTQVSRRLQDQTGVFSQGIETVAEAIQGQATTMEQALKSLGDSKTKLDDFLKGISDSHDEFLKRLTKCYDLGAIADIGSQLQAQTERSQAQTAKQLKTLIDNSQAQTVKQVNAEIRELKSAVGTTQSKTQLPLVDRLWEYVPNLLLATIAGASVLILLILALK